MRWWIIIRLVKSPYLDDDLVKFYSIFQNA